MARLWWLDGKHDACHPLTPAGLRIIVWSNMSNTDQLYSFATMAWIIVKLTGKSTKLFLDVLRHLRLQTGQHWPLTIHQNWSASTGKPSWQQGLLIWRPCKYKADHLIHLTVPNLCDWPLHQAVLVPHQSGAGDKREGQTLQQLESQGNPCHSKSCSVCTFLLK